MMSSILERTLKQTMSVIGVPFSASTGNGLQSLEKSIIGLSRTMGKQESRKMIDESRAILRDKCQDLKLSLSEKRHCLLIIIHLSNLDEKLPSIYPFVIKFIEDSNNLFDKLLGHISVRILSKKRSPDIYIAINTLQKDLSSKHSGVVQVALTTLASVLDQDMVPVFLPLVVKVFNKSNNSSVRYRALIVIEVMHSIGSEYLPNIWEIALRALCDKDPHVMSFALPLLQKLLGRRLPSEDCKICEKLIFILQQMVDGRLPLDMMYEGICAPWELIKILKILRSVPVSHFSETCFDNLTLAIQQTLSRAQVTSNIQVSVIFECIQVIAHFHFKLNRLENAALDAIDNVLSSPNPNIVFCGVEMVKCMKHVKPGVSKLYREALLHILSDSNPSAFNTTVQLLDDIVSSDDCKDLISDLMKKLTNISSMYSRKQIVLCILRIFEFSSCTPDHDWLVKNYLNLLQTLETELDYSLVQKAVNGIKLASKEVITEEIATLATKFNERLTPLQYCTMLELLSSFYQDVEKEYCESAIVNIIENMRSFLVEPHSENIMMHSWKVISEIAAYHNLEVEFNKSLSSCSENFSLMLQMQLVEMEYLLSDRSLLCMLFLKDKDVSHADETSSNIELAQGHKTDVNSTPHGTITSEPSQASGFRIARYSQSRFTDDEATYQLKEPKKIFLSGKKLENAPTRVWDQKKYKLHTDSYDSKNDKS